MLTALRSPTVAVRAAFFIQAICFGAFFSRLAEMQVSMHATPGQLGIALIGFDVGAFLSFPFAARMVERIGTRPVLLYGLPLFGLAVAASTLSPNITVFFAVSVFIAIGYTSTAIAMNIETDRIEYASRRRIMNSCHGMWSLGFFCSSLVGTGIVWLGIPPTWHLFGAVPVEALATVLLILPLIESPPRPHSAEAKASRFAIPTIATLMIALFAFGSIWLEAAGRNWSVIFLRDVHGAATWVATVVLPVWVGAQVITRLLADRWIERFGPVRVAMVLSTVSFAGLAIVAFGPNMWVALGGFVLIGIGVATQFPQALSAAARLGDRAASQNVASMQIMNSIILFLSPPVMGFTADHWGLRVSFALILPLLLIAIALSGVLAERPAAVTKASPASAGD